MGGRRPSMAHLHGDPWDQAAPQSRGRRSETSEAVTGRWSPATAALGGRAGPRLHPGSARGSVTRQAHQGHPQPRDPSRPRQRTRVPGGPAAPESPMPGARARPTGWALQAAAGAAGLYPHTGRPATTARDADRPGSGGATGVYDRARAERCSQLPKHLVRLSPTASCHPSGAGRQRTTRLAWRRGSRR